jgi:hypothetical protein
MTNRYEAAAAEVEARLEELRARKERFLAHPTLHTRAARVQTEIEKLEKLDLQKWRATGRWAKEIWG